MCDNPRGIAIAVIIRAIAAGVIASPQKAAEWAVKEDERLAAKDRERQRLMMESIKP